MSKLLMLFCSAWITLASDAQAAATAGQSFSLNDWELACDNTRTCRAAGYQSDSEELTVSVLLTRKASANQTVTSALRIGDSEEALKGLPNPLSLSMTVNGKGLGQVLFKKDSLLAALSVTQTKALLAVW